MVLLDIKDKQPFKDNKRLQKLISHYAIERDGMVILKPQNITYILSNYSAL